MNNTKSSYIGEEQEALINHVMESTHHMVPKRLIVLESESQAAKITIDDVAAYCLVNESGAVSYYMRKYVIMTQNTPTIYQQA